MKYKAGDKVRQTKNCSGTKAGKIYTVKYGNKCGDNTESLWIWDESTPVFKGGCNCQHTWKPIQTRSHIGKKAYKTFLKNGGTRDSKGRFSKKQEIDWEKVDKDISDAYWNTPDGPRSYPKLHTKAYFEVFKKHGLIREGVEI